MDTSISGFTGEYQDPVTGGYPMGNGYRWYLPNLMRFNAPDDFSPFGAGGINPYAYCADDPINHSDPSGHTGDNLLGTAPLQEGLETTDAGLNPDSDWPAWYPTTTGSNPETNKFRPHKLTSEQINNLEAVLDSQDEPMKKKAWDLTNEAIKSGKAVASLVLERIDPTSANSRPHLGDKMQKILALVQELKSIGARFSQLPGANYEELNLWTGYKSEPSEREDTIFNKVTTKIRRADPKKRSASTRKYGHRKIPAYTHWWDVAWWLGYDPPYFNSAEKRGYSVRKVVIPNRT